MMYAEEPDRVESVSDLFGKYRLIKNGTPLSERATLIKYFVDHARDKNNKPFKASFIGYKLSHLKVDDLYYMKSVLESETKRGGNFNKIFWGMLKPK